METQQKVQDRQLLMMSSTQLENALNQTGFLISTETVMQLVPNL